MRLRAPEHDSRLITIMPNLVHYTCKRMIRTSLKTMLCFDHPALLGVCLSVRSRFAFFQQDGFNGPFDAGDIQAVLAEKVRIRA